MHAKLLRKSEIQYYQNILIISCLPLILLLVIILYVCVHVYVCVVFMEHLSMLSTLGQNLLQMCLIILESILISIFKKENNCMSIYYWDLNPCFLPADLKFYLICQSLPKANFPLENSYQQQKKELFLKQKKIRYLNFYHLFK